MTGGRGQRARPPVSSHATTGPQNGTYESSQYEIQEFDEEASAF